MRVAVIYQVWPHYRLPVALEMDADPAIAYSFYGSGERLEGIEHLDISRLGRFVIARSTSIGRLLWQGGAVRAALTGRYDAIVLLANPNHLSTWIAAPLARLRGIPVLFWGHGWLRQDTGPKRLFRHGFYRLANHLLLYAERGKRLGMAAGWKDEDITVVYNSLSVDQADAIIARIERGELDDHIPQRRFADPDRPLIVCTARLTDKCRFHLLLDAAARLAERGRPINILLLGDGPERQALEDQARRLNIAAIFHGACYDETITGPLLYHADLTVSPGKIGLTALHSLMYGTPAITHGTLDDQMPEVEAIEPGRTGAFFTNGDAGSLADTIADWLAHAPDRATVRAACRATTRDRWNPKAQARILSEALHRVVNARRSAT